MIDYELMPHQKDAVYQSTFKKDLFLAFEVGTGKTPTAINILRQKYSQNGRLQRTLILAPLIVLKNWKKEISKFSKITSNAVQILDKTVAKRVDYIKSLGTRPMILLTNYDVFQNDAIVNALLSWGVEILVCDESHTLKNYKSKRAKNVAKIADQCQHRYLLTGTPILNNALDIFMQFRILDGGKTLGKNFFSFRHMYFEDENAAFAGKKGYFPKFVPRPSTYKNLNRLLDGLMLRVLKKDVLKDLPPLVEEEAFVEMSTEQKSLYSQMKRDFVAFVEGKLKEGEPRAVVAKLALTKALRLQEIVTGFAVPEDREIHRIQENPRLDKLKELLEDLAPRHKIIVWAVFKENYAQIREVCESLGIKYVEIHGDIPNKQKFESQDLFNTEESVRVLIGNPASGGVGINLIASDVSIYYSRDFKLSSELQSVARNHRKGSEIHEKITRINLVAPGTIDEVIAKALSEKEAISDLVIDRIGDF